MLTYMEQWLWGTLQMTRWKLFGRKKLDNKETELPEFISEEKPIVDNKSEPKQIEAEVESNTDSSKYEPELEKPVLAEYTETLHEGKSTSKDSKKPGDQRIWRDLDSIEGNVDNLKKHKTRKSESGLDEAVDKILSKKKK